MLSISANAPAQGADATIMVRPRFSYLPIVLMMGLALGLILTSPKRGAMIAKQRLR
jgi:hypothetical protein